MCPREMVTGTKKCAVQKQGYKVLSKSKPRLVSGNSNNHRRVIVRRSQAIEKRTEQSKINIRCLLGAVSPRA